MSESKDIDISKYKTHIKRKYVKKNHVVGAMLAIIFGGFGIYRIYMRKIDFIAVWILMLVTGFFFYYVIILVGIAYLIMSNKKFNLLCLCSNPKLEWKVFLTKENEIDALYDELDIPRFETWHDSMSVTINRTVTTYNGMPINVTVREKETTDTVRDLYRNIEAINSELHEHLKEKETTDTVGELYRNIDAINSDLHEHIKEDVNLKEKIDASQDRLERYQNNDYFPTANAKLSGKEKAKKAKELKEELKGGLISKEEYDEAITNLNRM